MIETKETTMRTGSAKLTATTHHFLDTCPAVKSWTPSADEKTAIFLYDESVEVVMVPAGVDFSDNAAPESERCDICDEATTLSYCSGCGRSVCAKCSYIDTESFI